MRFHIVPAFHGDGDPIDADVLDSWRGTEPDYLAVAADAIRAKGRKVLERVCAGGGVDGDTHGCRRGLPVMRTQPEADRAGSIPARQLDLAAPQLIHGTASGGRLSPRQAPADDSDLWNHDIDREEKLFEEGY